MGVLAASRSLPVLTCPTGGRYGVWSVDLPSRAGFTLPGTPVPCAGADGEAPAAVPAAADPETLEGE